MDDDMGEIIVSVDDIKAIWPNFSNDKWPRNPNWTWESTHLIKRMASELGADESLVLAVYYRFTALERIGVIKTDAPPWMKFPLENYIKITAPVEVIAALRLMV